ncbi:hypothetical protein MKR64_09490 [Acinetobacter baumannii]
MSFDLQKIRREGMRWHLLNALDKARPLGALDTLLLDVMRALYADTPPRITCSIGLFGRT